MITRLVLILNFCAACFGQQLQFFSFDGTTDTAISSNSFVVSPTGIGAKTVTRIHVRNVGTASVSVPRVSMSGQGFTITSTPFLPYTLASGAQMEVQVTFSPAVAGTYSASMGVNTATLILIGSSTAVGTLTVGGSVVTQLDFGNIAVNLKSTVVAYIEDRGPAAMTVKSIQVTGAGFTITKAPALPSTLLPTQTNEIDIEFAPTANQAYTGALMIDGLSYPLRAATFLPALPGFTVTVPSTATSQGQLPLSIDFAAAAAVGASGYVQMDFKPASGLLDDAAIQFLDSGRRTMNFTVAAGDTKAKFVDSSTTSFQTGTTAGTITFTAVVQSSTVKAVTSIAPSPAAICATLSKPNNFQLSVTISGYDNTRSASQLGFTFYACSAMIHDQFGNLVCQTGASQAQVGNPILYDASKDFSQYFATSKAGGAFTLLAQFPLSGSNSASVDAVSLTFANALGTGTIAAIPVSGLNACTGYARGDGGF